jgi:hypothetical protein
MNDTKPHEQFINELVAMLEAYDYKFIKGAEDIIDGRICLPVKVKKNAVDVMADVLAHHGLGIKYLQLDDNIHTWMISQSPKSHNVWHVVLNTNSNKLFFQWAYMTYSKQ